MALKQRFFSLLILLTGMGFVLFPNSTNASHAMGGEVCYNFIEYDSVNNEYVYEIIACHYNDERGISSPTSMTFDVYHNDTPNFTATGISVTLTNDFCNIIDYAQGGACDEPSFEVEHCCYSGTVALPPSLVGYRLYDDLCCRNSAISNINNPASTNEVWMTNIPPTYYENSSPCFTGFAAPFICASDTVCFSNSTFDPDGDLLVYSFATPYDSDGGAPPPDTVDFLPGYSKDNPFGPGGYASINSITGQTCFFAPNTGTYLTAVEVKEFRDGKLISTNRRTLQVIVENCAPNTPEFVEQHLKENYIIQEGDTLCFDVIGYALNSGDSVFVQGSGAIFDPGIVNPPATMPSNGNLDTVKTKFCWYTDCGQARAAPYIFDIDLNIGGCLMNTTQMSVSIYVTEFQFPPDSILGLDTVCINNTSVYTHMDTAGDYDYSWSVTNGTIITDPTLEEITVQWPPTPTTGEVQLIKYAKCNSDTVSKFIHVDSTGGISIVPTQDPVEVCAGEQVQISVNHDPELEYSWVPNYNISDVDIHNPVVWPDTTTIYTVIGSYKGVCFGETDIMVVVKPNPQVNAGEDRTMCIGDTVRLFGEAPTSDEVRWTPGSGLSNTQISNPRAYPETSTSYTFLGTQGECTGKDSVNVFVEPLPNADAGEDHFIKKGDCAQLVGSGGDDYVWTPDESLNNPEAATPEACPESTTTYAVKVSSAFGCTTYDTVKVYVSTTIEVPTAFSPNGDGTNDVIYLVGEGVEEVTFQIYNRWGEMVFETHDMQRGWDGTHRRTGADQPMGTYVYLLRGRLNDGEEVSEKGNITLIR